VPLPFTLRALEKVFRGRIVDRPFNRTSEDAAGLASRTDEYPADRMAIATQTESDTNVKHIPAAFNAV
jgi:hypothetical protein